METEAAKPNPDWLKTLIPQNYSSDEPPTHSNTEGLLVPALFYCLIHPEFVTKISMKSMDFDVDMHIVVEWHDKRLSYYGNQHLISSKIDLTEDTAATIWQPLIMFENAKGADNFIVRPDFIHIAPLWISASSDNKVGMNVFYRQTFTFTCKLKFASYPFDVQYCKMILMWAYNQLNPVQMMLTTVSSEEISVPPGFSLTSLVIVNEKNDSGSGPSGSVLLYNRKSIIFVFRRVFAQHIMLTFVPSILIVMLSWVSFWLDVTSAAPRVALGLTTLLTLATQFSSAQRDLPPVPEIKALDIWMFACMFMVFASLIEFAVADISRRFNPTKEPRMKPAFGHVYPYICNTAEDKIDVKTMMSGKIFVRKMKNFRKCCFMLRRRLTTSQIDYVSRIIFPLAFLIFNLCFWNYFMFCR